MNKYESIIILKPDLDENVIKATIDIVADTIESLAEENETKLEINDLGRRKLAYEIKTYKEGYYVSYNFYSEPEEIGELEKIYRVMEQIIKFIVVKK